MIRVLAVCTGNVCRSPYLQVVLGSALEQAAPGGFEVTSTGTGALAGAPADPGTRVELERRGLSAHGIRARQMAAAELEASDLVLTAERSHVEQVLELSPRMLKRTFTLPGFAALLEQLSASGPVESLRPGAAPRRTEQRWRRLPEVLSARRGRLGEPAPEIADPYRRGQEAFRSMAAEIDDSVRRIVGWERSMRAEPGGGGFTQP